MPKLGFRSIRQRLFMFMTMIILSLLCICFPLIINSYQALQVSKQDLIGVQSLRLLTHTANEISRERAYANKLMSSPYASQTSHRQALARYRKGVDQDINENLILLKGIGQQQIALQLQQNMIHELKIARVLVDDYAALPDISRTSVQYDHAVQAMFAAWDSYREILRAFVVQRNSVDSQLSDYVTMILLLSDLRDQAGRVASNVIASVSFHEAIPDNNRARSLQTQYQALYLWNLIDTLQPQYAKTPEYEKLHEQVKHEFLDEGVALVGQLLDESRRHEAYSMTGTQLTERIVSKFTPVVDLQKYLLDISVEVAKTRKEKAERQFILTLLLSFLSVAVALFTMHYAQKRIIHPLIQAKEQILELSDGVADGNDRHENKKNEFALLFSAIKKLQRMLQQRDALEFQLRNIANTDALTGVSNRLALDDYLVILSQHPKTLSQLCLMIIDIDNFKGVNDEYGHIVGDQVIKLVAEILKASVRNSDLIVRYGGDEFLVLVDEVSLEHALNLAEKIRFRLSQKAIETSDLKTPLYISSSIGVAVGALSWLDLFQKADQALLRAKAKGKNVVEG
ncbi:GGDEF domain-containing protein [Acinetobacter ursingii]|uniref:GGDEF domain-containing protein n=1 Tax=Acinetobacter ursingii TaxID=108980 RepID=UPI00124CE1A8|nr:GGDEF domain-containing protein [Acinetobacter ursingii]MCU4306266.1 GGDEF domain-containing protein [Acinetobacter ursingii]MCU4371807.1 GGDEF domain-containing protein [Acinetobacter ursingii]MCU4382729.1 GGDEF domain-containing protein [Acinetobacter ursingii]MDG9992941.1 GGDEF domain-containing protein [Acinetobacter ursingii]MDH0203806.1 GGDEF domain-containing protein [Acinetobacter ursingii]